MNHKDKTSTQLIDELQELQQKYNSVLDLYEKEKSEHRQTISEIEVLYSHIATSKAKLEATLESMNDAVFVSDTEGNFIDFNEAFATFHKFKNKDECAKTLKEYPLFLDVYKADGSLAAIEEWAVPRALRGETASNQEYTLHRKDTGEKWVGSYSLAPIRDQNGLIVGSVVTGRDITVQKQGQEKINELYKTLELKVEERTKQLSEANRKLSEELEIQKQMDLALSESQANLLPIFNANDESFLLLSADARVIAFNNIALNRLGQPTQEILGRNVFDILPTEVAQFLRPFFKQAINTCKPVVFEEKHSNCWMMYSIYPLLDESGKVNRVTVFSHDISERKIAEDDIRESEKRLKEVMENSLAASYKRNLISDTYDYLSPVFDKITGYTQQEMKSMPIADTVGLIHPDDQPGIDRVIAESTIDRHINVFQIEYRFKRKDGNYCWLHDQFTVMRDYEGKALARIGSVSNITDRKLAEIAVLKSKQQYDKLAANIPVGVYLLHSKPDGSFALDYASPPMAEILNQSVESLLEDATNVFKAIHPDDLADVVKLNDEGIRLIQPFDWIGRIISGGEIKWVHFRSVPEILDNSDVLWHGLITDITKEKLAEDAINEAHNRLLKIARLVPGVVYQFKLRPDGTSCFPYASEGIREIYGVTPEEVREDASKVFAVLHPDDLADVAASIQVSAKELSPWRSEYRVKFDDGTVRTVLGNAVPQMEADGSVLWHGFITNITERKLIEVALAESREMYKILAENSNDGVSLIDPEGKVIYVSPAYLRRLGYTEEDWLGVDTAGILNQLHPDDAGRIGAEIKRGRELKLPTSKYEYRVQTKSGEYIWLEDVLHRAFDQEGNFIHTVVNSRIITERKLAQQLLEESEEKYKSIFTTERDSMFLIDVSTYAILDVNEAACSLYGYTRDEMLNLKNYDLSAQPSETKRMTHELNERIHTRIHKKKDGSVFPVDISASKFVLHGQQVISASIRDISLLKQTEADLLKSNTRYETLVSTIPVGVYILRSKADGSFALDYVSARMAKMLNLDVKVMLKDSRSVFNSIHPDDRQGFMKLNEEGIALRQPFDWTGRILSKEEQKWMHFSSTPQLIEGGDVLWHGLILDITENINAEEEIKLRNEALLIAMSEKDKFFSIIAHDLRGPLGNSLELMKIMSENLMTMTITEINKIVDVVKNSSSNLYNLLENLLEWSRSQRGMTVFDPTMFIISDKLNECLVLPLEMANKKSIEVNVNVAKEIFGYTDEHMFTCLIRNLVSNAVKFTPKGGKVYIETRFSPVENHVTILVKDTGIGMSGAMIEKLFRLDSDTGRKGTEGENSTGLGLIICNDFITKMGGKLLIESEEGTGSTFSFDIPSMA